MFASVSSSQEQRIFAARQTDFVFCFFFSTCENNFLSFKGKTVHFVISQILFWIYHKFGRSTTSYNKWGCYLFMSHSSDFNVHTFVEAVCCSRLPVKTATSLRGKFNVKLRIWYIQRKDSVWFCINVKVSILRCDK